MIDYFPLGIGFVWRPENDGQPFHVTANDAGGATAWGVTIATWRAWQVAHGQTGQVYATTFARIPKEDFLPMYRANFWNACACGSLGAIGIAVFDAAVGSGPGHAALFLQHTLGVAMDGQIGPITVRVATQADQRALTKALCDEREAFYAKIPTARYFGRGWDRRAEACRDYVLSLLPA